MQCYLSRDVHYLPYIYDEIKNARNEHCLFIYNRLIKSVFTVSWYLDFIYISQISKYDIISKASKSRFKLLQHYSVAIKIKD